MEIVASGADDEGTVSVSAAALWNWTVTIAPGTIASVSEPEFCRRAGQAAQRLVADQYRQLRETRMRMTTGSEP